MAVVWGNSSGDLVITVFHADKNTGVLTRTLNAFTFASLSRYDYMSVALATSDLDGNGRDELIVSASTNYSNGPYVDNFVLTFGSGLGSVTTAMSNEFNLNVALDQPGLAAGTFLAAPNGMAQFVVGLVGASSVELYGYAPGPNLTGNLNNVNQLSLPIPGGGHAKDVVLAAGNLIGSIQQEIVVTASDQSGATYVWIVTPNSDFSALSVLPGTPLTVFGGAGLRTFVTSIGIGDFYGRSIRLGDPTYRLQAGMRQVQTIVSAPPSHYDVLPEVGAPVTRVVNVNFNEKTSASYETETGQDSSLSLDLSSGWGLSAQTSVLLGDEEASYIKGSFSASKEKSLKTIDDSLQDISLTIAADAWADDVVVYTETDYDSWEYPILTAAGAQAGQLAIVIPRKKDPTCSVNCAVSSTQSIQPGSLTPWYLQDHEPGNIFSYPQLANPSVNPTDVQTTVANLPQVGVSQSPVSLSFTQKVATSAAVLTASQTAFKASGGAGIGFEDVGQASFELEGDYSTSADATSETGFNQSTTLSLRFGAVENILQTYTVQPYLYWSVAGFLAFNFQVLPSNSSSQSFWQTSSTYAHPDPAFLLPIKYAECEDLPENCWQMTKDLRIDPPTPIAGQPLTITAIVRNYSRQALGTPTSLRLSTGDPISGQSVTLSDLTVPPIGAQSAVTVQTQWRPPVAGCYALFGTIDPADTLTEIHRDNNVAWTVVGVLTTTQIGPPSCQYNTSIGGRTGGVDVPGDGLAPDLGLLGAKAAELNGLTASAAVPDARGRITLAVPVRALGGHFTNVPIYFYDGHPAEGGRFVGAHTIPVIVAGETRIARVKWNPGTFVGRRTLYARIGVDGRLDKDRSNNLRVLEVDVAGIQRQYLPHITRAGVAAGFLAAVPPTARRSPRGRASIRSRTARGTPEASS